MSSGRRIVLHTGFHKTGTSTIQNVLYANRDLLLRQEGVLYPSLTPNLSTAFGTIFRDDPRRQTANRMRGLTTEEMAKRRKQYLDALDAEISSHEWDTLLLSAEGVSNLSESEIARLREWGEKYSSEWTVLVCVRHPLDWTRSVLQERLKQGDTLQQLYDKLPAPNYRLRVSRVISVFGRENVHVYDFESAAHSDGGIIGTFAQKAGLSASARDSLASRAVRYNESLSLEAVQILDSLNRQRPMFVDNVRAPHRVGPGRELAYLGRIKGRKFDVPDSVKEDIRSKSRGDVAWLNETFGLDLYGDVTDPAAPRAHSRQVPVQEAVLSDPAIDGIAEIVGELVTAVTFGRQLEQGRSALARGDLEHAIRALRTAARLDPDARQPKRLLKKAIAEQRQGGADAQQSRPSRK